MAVEPESWVHVMAVGGSRLGFEGKTAPWPFRVCQSMASGQEMRSFAAKMDTVQEIINNVNSCIFSTLSHKQSITFWVPDTSVYGNKCEQQDAGNNGNRSHLFASVSLLFLLAFDDICVTSSICFWFLGPGPLCLCGTLFLTLTFMLQAQLLVLYWLSIASTVWLSENSRMLPPALHFPYWALQEAYVWFGCTEPHSDPAFSPIPCKQHKSHPACRF